MANRLFDNFPPRFLDVNGNPLSSGTVTFEYAGTSTAAPIYSDQAGTAATNPQVLDAGGQFSTGIWGDETLSYKITVKDSGGSIVGPTQDDVLVGAGVSGEDAEWITQNHTPTRLTNTTFQLATGDGDQSAVYHVGRRIKLTDSSTLYGTITAVDYNSTVANATHVTVDTDSGNLSASLTAVSVGILSADNSSVEASAIVHRTGWTGAALRSVGDRSYGMKVSVLDFPGAAGDDSTDNQSAIDLAIAYLESIGGGTLYFPYDHVNGGRIYRHSGTIDLDVSNMRLEGESMAIQLKYTGSGTGIGSSLSAGSSAERCGIKSLYLVSTTGSKCIDFTRWTYGTFEDFEINYTATNAVQIYAKGNNGVGPYFNSFHAFHIIGNAARDVTGILLERDSSGNNADGPNANSFSNIKRIASIGVAIDIVSGLGNMFSNICFESVEDIAIRLNNIPSYDDAGTATSSTGNTLTDTGKSWTTNEHANDCLFITSGAGKGEGRFIVSNTATSITVSPPFNTNIGTASYAIAPAKAVHNKFTNLRMEGLASSNPDFLSIKAGSLYNEFRNVEIGSIGTGKFALIEAKDPSNIVALGRDIYIDETVTDPGTSATVDVWPLTGSVVNKGFGRRFSLGFIHATCHNYSAGSAVVALVVDAGVIGSSDVTFTASGQTITKSSGLDTFEVGDWIVVESTSSNNFCVQVTASSATSLTVANGVSAIVDESNTSAILRRAYAVKLDSVTQKGAFTSPRYLTSYSTNSVNPKLKVYTDGSFGATSDININGIMQVI